MVVYGTADHIGHTDQKERRSSGYNIEKIYRDYCAKHGIEVLDLLS